MLDKNEIRNALRDVMDPEIHQSIVDLNMVRNIVVEGNSVTVDLALTIAGCPMQSEIKTSVEEKVKGLPGVESVKVNLGVMDEDEKKALMEHLHGPKKTSPLLEPDSKTKIVMVASGKGGVGKSTVTVNLAVALARQGLKVGILDADIYGFSIPRMIGATQQPTALDENTIIPVETRGIKLISMGSFVNEDVPVVWRGPLLMKALEQFLTDVLWGDLDYLLLDSPPGTGDIAISVMQMLPRARVLIVTTPQVSAYKVAGRVGRLAQELKLEVLGVVENMSYFICDNCGKEHNIFGEGGGEITAKELNTKLLARIPLGAEIRERGDNGEPLAVESTESPAGKEFENMAKAVTQLWS